MRAKGAVAVLLAAWFCASPLTAQSGGVEEAWARGGRGFDGLAGRPADAVDGRRAGGAALAQLSVMGSAPETKMETAEKRVPAPEKKPGYWRYNDYSHSTGESVGMLALDIVAWVLAPLVVLAGLLGVLFSFLLPK